MSDRAEQRTLKLAASGDLFMVMSIFRRFPHRLLPYWRMRFVLTGHSSTHRPIRMRLYSWKIAPELIPAALLHMST